MTLERGLRVRLLGGLAVEDVPVLSLGSRKARAVLRRLAIAAGSTVALDDLVAVAWPEGPPVRAAEQLAVLVSRLRAVVGTERLPRTEHGYALLPDWSDVRALREHVLAGEAALADDGATAAAHGREAVALLRGPLLPEEPESEWAEAERHVVELLAKRARLLAAEAALATGAPWEALEQAERCREQDAYDEAALRLQLRSLAATGRPAMALTTYLEAATLLREELGTDPAPETERVYLALLATTMPPSPGPRRATRLPGRAEELAALHEALAQARSGRPQLVTLRGPAGMGKTSLLEAFAASLDETGTRRLAVHGERLGAGLPLQPVLDAIALQLRPAGPGAVRDLLGADAGLLLPLLGLADRSQVPAAQGPLTSGGGRLMLVTALEGLLTRLAGKDALVLTVDDAHLLDEASAQLLHHCTRPAAAARLLVVVAARSGDGPAWRSSTDLELEPLDRDAVAEVVGPARADELWQRSGGHPLFLSEIVRTAGSTPPDSVLAAIAQRCAGTDEVAGTLRVGAVIGLDLDLLALALDEPHHVVLNRLEQGARQGLLVEGPRGFSFRHELFREALAAGVGPTRAAALHRTAAVALDERPEHDPLRTAHHALLGGAGPIAMRALTAAAHQASARYEHEEAVGLLDRALEIEDDPAVRLERARSLLVLSRYEEAGRDVEAALARTSGAAALEVAALHAYHLRDLEGALELADQAARAATEPELAAACQCLAGRVLLTLGRLDEAESRLADATDLATGPMRAIAAVWRAVVLSHRDAPGPALRLARSPAAAASRTSPVVEPYRAMTIGRCLAQLGRAADALAAFEELEEVVRRQHVSRFAGRAGNFRGWVLRNLGADAEADEATRSSWDALHDSADVALVEARAHAALDLADSSLRRGDLDAAGQWLAAVTSEDVAPHVMKWRFDLRHEVLQARLALAQHESDLAERLARQVGARAGALGVERYEVQAGLLLVRAVAQRGGAVDAERVHPLADRLVTAAPLESWWMLAELARELRDDALGRQAAARVVALTDQSGSWAEVLRRRATQVLDGLPG